MEVPEEAAAGNEAAAGSEDVDRQDGKDSKMEVGEELQGDQADKRSRDRRKAKAEKANALDTDELEDKAMDGDLGESSRKMGKVMSRGGRRGQNQAGAPSTASTEQWGHTLKAMQAQLERLAAAQEEIQETLSILADKKTMASMGPSPAVSSRARSSPERRRSQRNERTSPLQEEQLVEEGSGIAEESEDMSNEYSEPACPRPSTQTQKTAATYKKGCTMQDREIVQLMTDEEETDKLRNIFLEAGRQNKELEEYKSKTHMQRFRSMSVEEKANVVDFYMGIMIVINMVVIGLTVDFEGNLIFRCVDLFLTGTFICEIIIKVYLFGVKGHFWPTSLVSKVMNWSDATFILIDLMQLFVMLAQSSEDQDGQPARTSILRVYRLMRLGRFVRLLRMEAFRDLMMMVLGLLKGMPTLAWSIVLLLVIFYVLALASRLALGHGGPGLISQEFETMERALFAVFRCSFGDCSASNGVSLIGMLIEHYGMLVGSICCLSIFFVTIGLFNVISAIFVQGTMTAWDSFEEKEKMRKFNDFPRFSENMAKLLVLVFEWSREEKPVNAFHIDTIHEWKDLEISTGDFKDACINDAMVQYYLLELDMHEWDLPVLADILDPQNDRRISIMDILNGITRLRGDPRRSDIVTIDLMVRDIQKSVGTLLDRSVERHTAPA